MEQIEQAFIPLHSTAPFPDECRPILNSIKRKLQHASESFPASCIYWMNSITEDNGKIFKIFETASDNCSPELKKWTEWNNFIITFNKHYTKQSAKKPTCIVCGKEDNIQRCSACRNAGYCSIDCQKKDWSIHSLTCNKN
jgi:hypothetical protein